MDPAARLAKFVAGFTSSDIPPHIGEAAKRAILDTIGCALGAVHTGPGRAALQVTQQQGGHPQAAVLGTGIRTSTLLAAYANARMANVLDYDETFVMQGHHAHSALAGALAACEWAGLGGRDLLTAFLLGFEVGARVGRYVSGTPLVEAGGSLRWRGLVGPVQGVFASAVAAAWALRLSEGQIGHVLGLCGHYMATRVDKWQTLRELPTSKYNDSGWAAHGGLMAALNARAGITGIPEPFSPPQPLWRVIREDGGDPAPLVTGLGEIWQLPFTSFKPWPSCRWIHYSLTALHQLVEREALAAEEVRAVTLLTFPQAYGTSCFHDAEVGDNLVHASFSYPHSAAMVLLRVPPGPAWFEPDAMRGEAAGRLRRMVSLAVEPASQDPANWGLQQGVLKIPSGAVVSARGRQFAARSDFAWGDPWEGAPAYGDREHIAKFQRQALSLAPESAAWAGQVPRLTQRLLHLEEEPGVSKLSDDLHPVPVAS